MTGAHAAVHRLAFVSEKRYVEGQQGLIGCSQYAGTTSHIETPDWAHCLPVEKPAEFVATIRSCLEGTL
jgi:hypothetical protein